MKRLTGMSKGDYGPDPGGGGHRLWLVLSSAEANACVTTGEVMAMGRVKNNGNICALLAAGYIGGSGTICCCWLLTPTEAGTSNTAS